MLACSNSFQNKEFKKKKKNPKQLLQNRHYANTAVTKTKPVCVMKNRRREKSFENSGRVNCLHLSFFLLFFFFFFCFSYLN